MEEVNNKKSLKIIKRTPLLINKYTRVFEDWFDGYDNPYYTINFSEFGGTETVILNNGKKIVLVNKIREASREATWTLPGGRIDKEDRGPEKSAMKEVKEETGYILSKDSLRKLGEAYISPARIIDKYYMFFGKASSYLGRKKSKELAEGKLEVREFEVSEVFEMIEKGKIEDMTSIAAIFLAKEKGFI